MSVPQLRDIIQELEGNHWIETKAVKSPGYHGVKALYCKNALLAANTGKSDVTPTS